MSTNTKPVIVVHLTGLAHDLEWIARRARKAVKGRGKARAALEKAAEEAAALAWFARAPLEAAACIKAGIPEGTPYDVIIVA